MDDDLYAMIGLITFVFIVAGLVTLLSKYMAMLAKFLVSLDTNLFGTILLILGIIGLCILYKNK